jgi:hypothetical protein
MDAEVTGKSSICRLSRKVSGILANPSYGKEERE